MNNYTVIRDYWQTNNLMNSNSIIHFHCTYTITLLDSSKSSSTENKAMIWLDSGSVNKVQILDFSGNPREFPTDFWLDYGIMSSQGNVLTVNGRHPQLGNYVATIIAHGQVI